MVMSKRNALWNVAGSSIVTKIRDGKVKKRLMLDAKASGTSVAGSKLERVILPRLLDTARNTVEMLSRRRQDAFWLLPLAPDERKWFTSRLRGKYYAFLRNAQGSRNAPLGWACVAALLARLTQGMFSTDEVLMEVLTDDTCIVVGGCKDARNEYLCRIILAWMALGLPLSWRKGLRGAAVPSVGGEFAIHSAPACLVVKIKQDLFEATETLLVRVRQSNVISHRDFSALIGKLGNIGNLLVVLRPFLAPLSAALYSTERTGAPLNCWKLRLS